MKIIKKIFHRHKFEIVSKKSFSIINVENGNSGNLNIDLIVCKRCKQKRFTINHLQITNLDLY